jgi:hypothetical protein
MKFQRRESENFRRSKKSDEYFLLIAFSDFSKQLILLISADGFFDGFFH